MSCGFLATSVRNVLGDGSALGVRLRFVEEPDPRGTAGALKFAESLLDERFLVLNGDVLTDIDLTAQIAQHERTGRGRRSRSCRSPILGLRPGAPERGSLGARLRREAELGQHRHEPDQRGRLRAAAQRARARAGRRERLDRARGLAAADRRRPLRLSVGGLLAGHRHARALPAGHLRHHRGQRPRRPSRGAWATTGWRSTRTRRWPVA